MNAESVKKSAPVQEKPRWLQFEFVVRQIGFVLLLLIVLGALAGAFSKGYLSEKSLSNQANTLKVDYEKFNRLLSDVELKISFAPAPGKPQQIKLGGDFMHGYRIDNLLPQPDKMYSQHGELIVEYSPSMANATQTIWLSLTPMQAGELTSHVVANQQAGLTFSQFVYP
ncbi:hypothetical protein EHN07_03645 [Buttiauxella warmboldiae]|uniref:Uncharacterized protein n=1 Tax=Buttiauxella warmboldiae TaxID=82993 RepID=A0A3N5DND9_9ENTR|nr:hypothetical protein [Buttiauxella warmboldiae]RPH30214.1 hypothetical protein EHN07_03645 [Buttiauxella warmboldiae]